MNPHEPKAHYALNVARLPIPPLRQWFLFYPKLRICQPLHISSSGIVTKAGVEGGDVFFIASNNKLIYRCSHRVSEVCSLPAGRCVHFDRRSPKCILMSGSPSQLSTLGSVTGPRPTKVKIMNNYQISGNVKNIQNSGKIKQNHYPYQMQVDITFFWEVQEFE